MPWKPKSVRFSNKPIAAPCISICALNLKLWAFDNVREFSFYKGSFSEALVRHGTFSEVVGSASEIIDNLRFFLDEHREQKKMPSVLASAN